MNPNPPNHSGSNLVSAIEDACRNHSIHEVLGVPDNKRLIICPLPQHAHHQNTPSFSIFWRRGKQWWRCHGSCDAEGDVVDLVGYLRLPDYHRYHLPDRAAAAELLGSRYQARLLAPPRLPTLAGDEWARFLPPGPQVLAYAAERGLTPATLERFRFGQHEGCMSMPCFEEGRLVGIKLRSLQPSRSHSRFWQLPGSRQGLFNIDSVRCASGPVLVVKGEIPCALLSQLGYPAVAPTGGEAGWNERWRVALALAQCIVIGDNDPPGKTLAEKRSRLLGAGLEFPPEKYKDVDEWCLADPRGSAQMLRAWIDKYAPGWSKPSA
jgi:hypothetical protein